MSERHQFDVMVNPSGVDQLPTLEEEIASMHGINRLHEEARQNGFLAVDAYVASRNKIVATSTSEPASENISDVVIDSEHYLQEPRERSSLAIGSWVSSRIFRR